ncbi:oogenesis-related [Centroberyx affinis]|uniref:oogenesis-related n=1 Tax=Centroberyx affinis TaxID=166261 RepID=UPI003A5C3FEA
MTSEYSSHAVEQEQVESVEDQVVKRDGVLHSMLHRLSDFWPINFVVRACRAVWWMVGFPLKRQTDQTSSAASTPARQSLAGRKRLHWVTRLLLSVLPRRAQSALGYPVSSTIGCSLSPEVRVSPTKPCGKGSKRKQDELDEEEEEEQQTWVEALTQELADEGSEDDPDYEPSTVETESDEYCSHNNTESDIEIMGKGVIVIEDVKTVNSEYELMNNCFVSVVSELQAAGLLQDQ